jgi:alpha-N-arabinofuranosidase
MYLKNYRYILIVALVFTKCTSSPTEPEKNQKLVAQINIAEMREPVTKYMYGMFLEHLGNVDVGDLIDDGLWAEVLDDRKFFYPVDQKDELVPVSKRNNINQWVPLNNPEFVVMDSANSYVGIHTPKILTNNNSPEGIVQSGLGVAGNTKYVGRIILAGSPNVDVTVRLIWGDNPSQGSTFKIPRLTNTFNKYHFELICGGDSGNARFEISGTANGSFSIGAVSLMPEDNVFGFRADVIHLLKGLNSGIYRWGGNMSSGYDWRDGIGDLDRRPPRYEYAWEGMENNDVGTHELLKFAELINVELCLTVNAGFGDANSAAQWVEYVNGSRDTPMGKLRASNGQIDPFNVKFWCVGNESYGWWQLGHTNLKNHIIKHNMFVEKMIEVDPSIKLIASGASLEEMTVTGSALRATGKILAEYDSASDWSGGMLRQGNHIDYMSEHFYCAVDQRFDIKEGKYVNVDEPLVDWTRRPANRVRAKAEHYLEYHRRIPESVNSPIYMDEWAYFTNWVHPRPTLGVAIGYARALNEMFRHTELIKMSGFTFGTSCLSFTDTDVIYNASGLLFKLYQSQFGSIPVRIEGNSPQPSPQWPIGGGQPSLNAGGDTYPLDVVAALTSDKKELTVAVVNPTEKDQLITFEFIGPKISSDVKRWTITGATPKARNVIGQAEEISWQEGNVVANSELTIAPISINIFRYVLQ